MCFAVDLRTIGICNSPLIVDRSPPVAGVVNDGELPGIDLNYTKYENKVVQKREENNLESQHVIGFHTEIKFSELF